MRYMTTIMTLDRKREWSYLYVWQQQCDWSVLLSCLSKLINVSLFLRRTQETQENALRQARGRAGEWRLPATMTRPGFLCLSLQCIILVMLMILFRCRGKRLSIGYLLLRNSLRYNLWRGVNYYHCTVHFLLLILTTITNTVPLLQHHFYCYY